MYDIVGYISHSWSHGHNVIILLFLELSCHSPYCTWWSRAVLLSHIHSSLIHCCMTGTPSWGLSCTSQPTTEETEEEKFNYGQIILLSCLISFSPWEASISTVSHQLFVQMHFFTVSMASWKSRSHDPTSDCRYFSSSVQPKEIPSPPVPIATRPHPLMWSDLVAPFYLCPWCSSRWLALPVISDPRIGIGSSCTSPSTQHPSCTLGARSHDHSSFSEIARLA